MGINKEKIKKDFEEKPIIDYILDCFNKQQAEKDDEFYADTLVAYDDLINSKDISEEKKQLMKNKMSFFNYFMNKKTKTFLNPYLLFDNAVSLSSIKVEDLDVHFKEEYNQYLTKLQQMHQKNGMVFGKRAEIIASMTNMIKKNYFVIKDEKARKEYQEKIEKLKKTQENYDYTSEIDSKLIDKRSIRYRIKDLSKEINFINIGDLNIANIGLVRYKENVTGIDRELSIYAVKNKKDLDCDFIFANLDLANLDSLNYHDEYMNEKENAEERLSKLLSNKSIKSALKFNNGYVGDLEFDSNGEVKRIYDVHDETVVAIAGEKIIEKIYQYKENNQIESKNVGGETKSEEYSER